MDLYHSHDSQAPGIREFWRTAQIVSWAPSIAEFDTHRLTSSENCEPQAQSPQRDVATPGGDPGIGSRDVGVRLRRVDSILSHYWCLLAALVLGMEMVLDVVWCFGWNP